MNFGARIQEEPDPTQVHWMWVVYDILFLGVFSAIFWPITIGYHLGGRK